MAHVRYLARRSRIRRTAWTNGTMVASCAATSALATRQSGIHDSPYEAHKPNAFLKLPHPSNYKLRALVDDGEVILGKLREWEAQRARPKAAQGGSGS